MRPICGENNCHTLGFNCCYRLVDHFFTREFMHQCSWGGGSRTPDTKKYPFKTYERTIRLFFELIRLADPTFTEDQLQHFFLGVLRNSKKRCLPHGPRRRSSMKRKRHAGHQLTSTEFAIQLGGESNSCFVMNDPTALSIDEYSGEENTQQYDDGDEIDDDDENTDEIFEMQQSFKMERNDEGVVGWMSQDHGQEQ